jgi:hypothetical protein
MDAHFCAELLQCGERSATEIGLIFEGRIKGNDVRGNLSSVVSQFSKGLGSRSARCDKTWAMCRHRATRGLRPVSRTSRQVIEWSQAFLPLSIEK